MSSSESSPPAASAPDSGGAQSLDPVEATPPLLPAPETVSSTFHSPPLALSLVSNLLKIGWKTERRWRNFDQQR